MIYKLWQKPLKNYPKHKILIKAKVTPSGHLQISTCNTNGTTLNELFLLRTEGYLSLTKGLTNQQFIRNKEKGHIIATAANQNAKK